MKPTYEELKAQLEASQAREQGSREALKEIEDAYFPDSFAGQKAQQALSTPALDLKKDTDCVSAWLIENGKAQGNGLACLTMRHGMFVWTEDAHEALQFVRRDDAEKVAEECEDAWRIVEHGFASPDYKAQWQREALEEAAKEFDGYDYPTKGMLKRCAEIAAQELRSMAKEKAQINAR